MAAPPLPCSADKVKDARHSHNKAGSCVQVDQGATQAQTGSAALWKIICKHDMLYRATNAPSSHPNNIQTHTPTHTHTHPHTHARARARARSLSALWSQRCSPTMNKAHIRYKCSAEPHAIGPPTHRWCCGGPQVAATTTPRRHGGLAIHLSAAANLKRQSCREHSSSVSEWMSDGLTP
jgi:hypothetical protein